jgi:excisionase family DNA binding protein
MHVPTQKPLFDVEQAAIALSVTPRHVRRLWQLRQLAGIKVGRLVRFSEEDLEAYIARQRVEAIAQRPSVRRVRTDNNSTSGNATKTTSNARKSGAK